MKGKKSRIHMEENQIYEGVAGAPGVMHALEDGVLSRQSIRRRCRSGVRHSAKQMCAWMYEVTVVAGGRYLRKRCRIEK
jgi:hypothetical protein